jgi:hypothetical protein
MFILLQEGWRDVHTWALCRPGGEGEHVSPGGRPIPQPGHGHAAHLGALSLPTHPCPLGPRQVIPVPVLKAEVYDVRVDRPGSLWTWLSAGSEVHLLIWLPCVAGVEVLVSPRLVT